MNLSSYYSYSLDVYFLRLHTLGEADTLFTSHSQQAKRWTRINRSVIVTALFSSQFLPGSSKLKPQVVYCLSVKKKFFFICKNVRAIPFVPMFQFLGAGQCAKETRAFRWSDNSVFEAPSLVIIWPIVGKREKEIMTFMLFLHLSL